MLMASGNGEGKEWLNLNQEENNFVETIDSIYNDRILGMAAPD